MFLPLLLALATQAQDTTHLVIVATADLHGRAMAWDYLADRAAPGGLTRAASVVDSLRARYPGRVVLVDAGDLLQGDPFATYFAREAPRDPHPLLDLMGAMGYDAATPGNHDFDFGVPFLFRSLRAASFPFVSGNLYALPRDTLALPPWTLVQRGGVRVGITGFTTPGTMVWNRTQLRDHARVAPVPEVAPRVLRELRNEADFTVVLLHSGLEGPSSYDSTGIGAEHVGAALARTLGRRGLIVLGHSHREVVGTAIEGVHLVQPGAHGRSLAVTHVTLERTPDGWRQRRIRSELVTLGMVPPSAALERRLVPDHAAVRRWVAAPLGNVAAPFPASTARVEASALANFINDVQRRRSGADLSTTPVFDLRAGLEPGEVSRRDFLRLYPYENTLRAVRVTGDQLRRFLEHSARAYVVDGNRVRLNDSVPGYDTEILAGAEFALDLRFPPGERVRGLTVRGRPVQPGDQFTLALTSHRQQGAGGYTMLAGAPVVYDRDENIRDLLQAEVRARGVLDPGHFATINWRIVPDELARAARRIFAVTPDPVRPPPPRDTTLLRIFATGDLHGAFQAQPRGWSQGRPVGGMPALKRLMDSLAAACACPDLRLDAGDQMQGTLASNLEFGRSTVAALNLLGLDAAVVGNHDFDWSVDTLQRRMAESRYTWLLANVVDSATGKRPDWAIPWRVFQTGPLRVGVIGYITPETRSIVRGDILQGLAFPGPESLAEPLAALRAERPDLVIVLAHEGGECPRDGRPGQCAGAINELLAGLDSGSVDLVIGGHRHLPANTRVKGIPVVQTGSSGGDVAVIDVVRTLVGGREIRPRLVPVYSDSIGADSAMVRLVAGFIRKSDSLAARVVATLKAPAARSGGQYPLGNLVADAHRNALRADFAIMNNGGIRTGLPAGPVNYAQVFEVSPFGNGLVRVHLTGRDLKAILEHALGDGEPGIHVSGMVVIHDPGRPTGQRVREIRLPSGRKVEDRRTYTLAVNDFLAGGKEGYEMMPRLRSETTGITDTDALVNYLRRLPQPVELPRDSRFTIRR